MNLQSPPVIARPPKGSGSVLALFAGAFHRMLDAIDAGIVAGCIETILPDGSHRQLGGRGEGQVAALHIVRWHALLRLATGGSAGWYVAWAKGEWTSPDPVAMFTVFAHNRRSMGDAGRSRGLARLLRQAINRAHRNTRAGSRRNVAAHYDLGNDFYALWLDPTLSYSSALFVDPAEPLEEAQHRKLAAILERTGTQPGDHVLEIGCGWGSFVEVAAKAGRRVDAITLSAEQRDWVEQRSAANGLGDVRVTLTDYRDVTGQYDAIASIEMVEAVGQDFWPAYLDTIARALKPGGRAAIQYIAIDDAIFDSYAANVDFIQRYVFPGGMLLSESRFRALAEARGLRWEDPRSMGADYAETLVRWRAAFDRAVDAGLLPSRFDSNFIKLWRFYLMYCEGAFRGGSIDAAQVTLVKR